MQKGGIEIQQSSTRYTNYRMFTLSTAQPTQIMLIAEQLGQNCEGDARYGTCDTSSACMITVLLRSKTPLD